MQQATSPGANLTPKGGSSLPPAADQTRFVINLCASTTPVGLVQPSHAGLKRFTFFVSRRREEGRERFRLHMGYFESQEEAERLLDLVREIYPAAWASVAPGQRLRARAALGQSPAAPSAPAPAAVAAVTQAAPPAPTAPATIAPPVPAPVATAAAAAAAPPTLIAAPYVPAMAAPTAPPQPKATPQRASAPSPVLPSAPAAQLVPPPSTVPLTLDAPPPARAAASGVQGTLTAPAAPAAPSVAAPSGASLRAVPTKAVLDTAAVHSLSNIRAAIESLRDQPADTLAGEQVLSLLEGAPRQMPGSPPAPPAAPVPPALRAPGAPKAAAKAATVAAHAPPSAASAAAARVAARSAPPHHVAPQALAAPPRTEASLFAVQLLWSVQAIDMSQVPQLAIFSAYTLYGAEGNRDGRRWYGLRLGFFTDAVSAKQVAQYVRSEFSAVSVVPVSTRERDRASAATATPVPTPTAAKGSGHELSFIEDTSANRTLGEAPAGEAGDAPKSAAAPSPPAATAAGAAPRVASGKRAKLRVAQGTRPVPKRPRHDGPLTLEETLEILGASTLQIDEGRGERLNHAGAPARGLSQPKPRSGSRIGRLMDRLAERFSGG